MNIRKLSTREIFNKNQGRQVPDGFDRTRLLLHNIRSMHNVGSVFRSADAFGLYELLLSGYTPTPPRAEIAKTALGAEKHVAWTHFGDYQPAIEQLRSEGYHILGVEQTNVSISLIDFTPPKKKPVCLVLGNEVTGLDDGLLPYIDEFVEIPQYGHKHSLNVSVTAGIMLFALLDKYGRLQDGKLGR